jgi:hypothetical protein
MPKKEPLQGGEPIRGDDTPIIVQDGYSVKIPIETNLKLHGMGR